MNVEEAQREVRTTYLGGFPGQLVSGLLWLASAAFGTWGSRRTAIAVLALGGAFIFPATQLLLRALGRRASLRPENPLGALAMQIAFTIPLSLPLIGAATLHRVTWFYPAFMIVVGAHYLPFVFLYGMRHFAVLCALLVGGATAIGLYLPQAPFSLPGWITGGLLVLFALVGLRLAPREQPA